MTRRLENWTPIATEYHPLTCGSIDGTDDYPHDKGILRALNSKYKPNRKVDGDPLCTIFVGRLNPDTTEDTLEEFFGKYGAIKRLRLVRDMISGFSKRYAFIEYKSGSSARTAAVDAHQRRLDDRRVLVAMECERELKGWIPRRLGGGFGGKKESGQLRFGGKDKPFKRPIILDSVIASRSSSSVHSMRSDYGQSGDSYRSESRQSDSYYRHRDRSAERDNSHYTSSKGKYRDTSDHRRRGEDDKYRYDDRRRERSRSQERSRKRKYRDEESEYRTLSEHKKSKHKHKHKKHKHRSRSRSQS